MKIQPFTHYCIVQSGPCEGNKYYHNVSEWDIADRRECDNCGEPLASIEEVVAHMYAELVDTEWP